MKAPVTIVVESPDKTQADLVGQAVGQALRENYGFSNVAVAHIRLDQPGFRAWEVHGDATQESLLDAMREANPLMFDSSVTIVTRESQNTYEVDLLGMPNIPAVGALLSMQGFGEEGITAEEALVLDGCIVEQSGVL